MCSTTTKCLRALNANTKTCPFLFKKRTFFDVAVFLFLLCDATWAQNVNINNENKTPSHSNKGVIKNNNESVSNLSNNITIHAFYDDDFFNINLNISWIYQLEDNIPFDIILTKLETEKCRGTITYPKYKAVNTNSVILDTRIYKIEKKCSYEIGIFPITDRNLEPLKIEYTVPDTADVSNVRAYAFNDEEKDDNKGKVKLNITWDNPTDDILPKKHRITILHLNCGKDTRHIEVHDIPGVSTTKIINPDNFVKIIPGCTYNIEVKAEPSNDLDSPSINYTLPECVGKICSCRYDEPIPIPKINNIKQITDTTFRVTWTIYSNLKMEAVHNLTTIYFQMHTAQHIYLPEYSIKKNITNAIVNKKQFIDFEIDDIISGAFYELKTCVENQDYCTSEFDFKTIQAKHIYQEIPWMYSILIPVMFILMCFSFIWIMWKKKCCWILSKVICVNHSNQPQIRRIYRPANTTEAYHRNRPLLQVPMEFNNLYVEKEILEELERGKVDKYEISYTRLQIGREIGGGAFGQVFVAKARAIAGFPGYSTVAVKKLKKTANPEELEKLLLEISMLKQVGRHPNIVTLLGCCTINQPYCMIMEYVPCGDLLHYLIALRVPYEQKGKAFLFTMSKSFDSSSTSINRQKLSECSYISQPETIPLNRLPSLTETECTELGSDISEIPHMGGSPKPPITPRTPAVLECVLDPKELQNFAIQIARGMEHLERKHIVHRDLAARNVLIDENKTLKISDFGLSRRGIYVNSKPEKVPLRWLSVEAIRYNIYTSKSDVWAYGIVLWEIGTLGGFPYPMVGNGEILNFLSEGKRLEKPENCTDELYELMQMCWTESVDQRPSFTELVEHLEAIANKRRVYIDFSQLNPSYVFPPTEQQTVTNIKTEDNVKIIEMIVT